MKTFYFVLFIILVHSGLAQTSIFSYGSQWSYKDDGSDQGTAWITPAFNDVAWSTGTGQFGYGDGDEATIVNACGTVTQYPSCTNKYPTTYFRKTVNIANASLYAEYVFHSKFDDGIIVYVNGTEVFRNNMPSGAVSYSAYASGDVSGDGNTELETVINAATAGFVTGTNVIAVEIHQRNGSSSDVSFDMELLANETVSQQALVTYGSNWKYKDDGSDQGTTWIAPAFSDAAWSSGAGQLGYGDGDETTLINACGTVTQYPSCTNKYITTYFRKTINIPNAGIFGSFQLNMLVDDGAVVYINGTEVFRVNLPAGAIDYLTIAPSAISGDGNTVQTTTLSFPASALVSGNNTIAVEVHQNGGSSSDVTFDLELIAMPPVSGGANIVRGPYLQTATPSSILIHWKTDNAVDSKITYGTDSTNLNLTAYDAASTNDHVIELTGLAPYTRYFYSVGSSSGVMQYSYENYFVTSPVPGTEGKYTFWVNGDCGTNATHQKNVRDMYLNYIGNNVTNGWLLLGDNAYNSGTEGEYTSNFFDIYEDNVMKKSPLWPCPGNHDYANSGSRQNDHAVPYYDIFDCPVNGEAGGVPSNSEAFYSYDYGNIHFLSLDSYGKENNATRLYDTLGAQATWVKADLAANDKEWVIAYWHHPPYTMGSHNSDSEGELVEMREKFIRILEREGVDLILCGHSHDYERSCLMNGHYGYESSFNPAVHNLSSSSGRYDGSPNSCMYLKDSVHNTLNGTVYVVAGSSGKLGGTQSGYPHNAMYFSDATHGGSMVLEIESNRLDAKWICADGITRDNFTIIKNAGTKDTLTINYGESVTLNATWVGDYIWSNAAETSRGITVSPATSGILTVTDQYLCIADTFVINVIQPTSVVGTLTATQYCAGDAISVPFSVQGNYDSGNSFELQLSDETGDFSSPVSLGTLAGTVSATMNIVLPGNSFSGAGYRLRLVSSSPAGNGSMSAPFAINALPVVTAANNGPLCDGQTVTLNETAGNSISWTWTTAGGATITNSGNQSTDISGAADGDSFTVTGTDANGCVNSASTTITINPIPAISANGSNPTTCNGNNGSITVNGSASGNITVDWSGTTSGSQSGATLPYSIASLEEGNYQVIYTDETTGCQTVLSSVTLSDPALPVITAVNNGPVCDGQAISLNETGGNAVTWTWTTNGGATISNANGQSTSISGAVNGDSFTVTGTDANGCTETSSTIITINPIPAISASSSNPTTCNGTNGSVTVSGSSTGNVTVSWSGSASGSQSAATLPYIINGLEEGNYDFIYLDETTGCEALVSSVTLIDPTLPVITATNNGPVCEGQTISLNETGGNAVAWTWTTNGSATISNISGQSTSISGAVNGDSFTVTGTDANGCSETSTTIITINTVPSISVNSMDPTTCNGTNGSVTVDGSGSGNVTVNWSGTLTGSQTGVMLPYTITGLEDGNYTLSYTDEATFCETVQSAVVLTDPALPIVIASSNSPVCEGESIILTETGGESGIWIWSTNGNATIVSGTDQSTAVTGASDGDSFTVTGTDANGCSETASVTIAINALPVVTLNGLSTSYEVTDGNVLMNGTPSGGTYNGQGVTGNTFSPSAAGIGGPYNIVYFFQDGNGCENSDTVYVTVSPEQLGLTDVSVNGIMFSVFPNPASDHLTVSFTLETALEVELALVDQAGKVCKTAQHSVVSAGKNVIEFTLDELQLAEGNYFLKVKAGDAVEFVKVIVQ